MAITKVWRDLRGQEQAQEQFDPSSRTYTYSLTEWWQVQTDSLTTSAVSILGATDGTTTVPSPGGLYAVGGAYMWCTQAFPQRASQNLWNVQVTYGLTMGKSTSDSSDRWNIQLSIDGQKWTQDAHKDKDGKPIYNSAGQYYNPSLPEEHNDTIIQVAYETSTADINTMQSAIGLVNSDPVSISIKGYALSATARTLKLDVCPASTTIYPDGSGGQTPVWKLSPRWIYRPDGWTDNVVDRGFCELKNDENGVKRLFQMFDNNGQPLNEPAYLDGNGQRLVINPTASPPTSAVFRQVKVQKEVAMATMFTNLNDA